jgi:hypothetical protein
MLSSKRRYTFEFRDPRWYDRVSPLTPSGFDRRYSFSLDARVSSQKQAGEHPRDAGAMATVDAQERAEPCSHDQVGP